MNALASILLASSDGRSLWQALARSVRGQLEKQESQAPLVIAGVTVVVLLMWINVRIAIRLVRGPRPKQS